MKVQQFLTHHEITENPFGQEDASADHVFRKHCLNKTHHPAWDKIFGEAGSPSTSVVFGEKGAGKTALRMQIVSGIEEHNQQNPDEQVFVIEYDDFNPFLDSFRERLSGRKRKPERALSFWRLWDHMDAILSQGVTRLNNMLLDENTNSDELKNIDPKKISNLGRLQKRDLLLLTSYYDHTFDQPRKQRFAALRKKLGFRSWWSKWDCLAGVGISLATFGILWKTHGFSDVGRWWYLIIAIVAAGWVPWSYRQFRLFWLSMRVKKQIRVFDHQVNILRNILSRFNRQEFFGQPAPSKDRSDDRYELLLKFQSALKYLGYTSILVLVDRVDEPHLINGNAERMRDFIWPMFDNKFLKHPGIGFKLLLPSDLAYYLNREDKTFYERSRLDKQNLIPSLDWTGQSLYDVTSDRIRACTKEGAKPRAVHELFESAVTEEDLISIFDRLRVPRHLFKFFYRLLVEHCNKYTDESPQWQITRETLQSTFAVYLKDLDAFDRGQGTG